MQHQAKAKAALVAKAKAAMSSFLEKAGGSQKSQSSSSDMIPNLIPSSSFELCNAVLQVLITRAKSKTSIIHSALAAGPLTDFMDLGMYAEVVKVNKLVSTASLPVVCFIKIGKCRGLVNCCKKKEGCDCQQHQCGLFPNRIVEGTKVCGNHALKASRRFVHNVPIAKLLPEGYKFQAKQPELTQGDSAVPQAPQQTSMK